jgi:SAM-dependent methyltransferase
LQRGRAHLLAELLARHAPGGAALELLEIGAGVGQNIATLAQYGDVDAIEIDAVGLAALAALPHLRRVYAEPVPRAPVGTYDVICALDVLEHLDDDAAALAWLGDHLRPGGALVATVPAYGWLFGPHDVALEHRRRYSARDLRGRLPATLELEQLSYFNTALFPAAVATRLAGRRRAGRRAAATKQSARLPAWLDRLCRGVLRLEARAIGAGAHLPFGLTLVFVARRGRRRAR